MKINQITDDHISMFRECLTLDTSTGKVFWKKKVSSKTIAGNEAGTKMTNGYVCVQLHNHRYLAHRIVYAMVHGACDGEIDHINGNKSDNRPENLRLVTRSQQNMNRAKQANNTSGHKGVYWLKPKGYWAARVKVDGKYKCLGYFRDIEEAAAAYQAGAKKYHGEFMRATA